MDYSKLAALKDSEIPVVSAWLVPRMLNFVKERNV